MLGTGLDDHTNLSCTFGNLLWYIDPHYNELKSRNCCALHEVTLKNVMNFNKPSKHRHKAKTINSTDAHIKVNNLLEYLDQSYFFKTTYESTQRTCIRSMWSCKYLEYLNNQVSRTTEAQNNRLIEV